MWQISTMHVDIAPIQQESPRAVTEIDDEAFERSLKFLTKVEICDEIGHFVNAAPMGARWNHSIHEWSLRTYCFLVRCIIPERLGLVLVRDRHRPIFTKKLRRIPTVSTMGFCMLLSIPFIPS